MLFWIVLGAVVVLAVVVLAVVAHGVLGAFGRLDRELEAAERDVRPLLERAQATAARAGELGDRPANRS
ncbi:hypothetical protein [Blastococcus deserti]|uniref:Uncharacterized protein n=1 Tax=Blastococcus deserti TaxID=2259033 RepID=A0ABW4XE94_9ACTN